MEMIRKYAVVGSVHKQSNVCKVQYDNNYYVLKSCSTERERFKREIESLTKCQPCEYIVKLVETFTEEDVMYIVMPFYDSDVGMELATCDTRPHPESIRVLEHVAKALDFMHGINIGHRDLHPFNILIKKGIHENENEYILADLGEAKQIDVDTSATMTATVTIEQYKAPEQEKKNDHYAYNKKVDLWSLGVLCIALYIPTVRFEELEIASLGLAAKNGDGGKDERHMHITIREQLRDYPEIENYAIDFLKIKADDRLTAGQFLQAELFQKRNVSTELFNAVADVDATWADCEVILRKGLGQLNAKNPEEMKATPLMKAVMLGTEEYLEKFTGLLRMGADPEVVDKNLFTVKHFAADAECKKFLEVLLEHTKKHDKKLKPAGENIDHETPIYRAISRCDDCTDGAERVFMLTELGEEWNADSQKDLLLALEEYGRVEDRRYIDEVVDLLKELKQNHGLVLDEDMLDELASDVGTGDKESLLPGYFDEC